MPTPSPSRPASRTPFPSRLQVRVLSGLRSACTASASLLRRLDRDIQPPADPTDRAYA